MNVEMVVSLSRGEHGSAALDKLIKKNIYIPYEEKISMCKEIVRRTCWKKVVDIDGQETNERKFQIDSPGRFFAYAVMILRTYTDISFSDNVLADFNTLQEEGLIDTLLDKLSDAKEYQREMDQFSTIMDMVVDDELVNEHSMESILENKLNSLILLWKHME